MITFICPSCNGKCQVGDEMSGRKMKCPKCGTRIRHHADGTIELLTLNVPPLPVPGAPSAAEAAPLKESTAILAHVADKLLSKNEGQQNTVVIWSLVGFLALALAGGGLILGSPAMAVAPIALALVAAFVWFATRAKRRQAVDGKKRDEAKTEAIPKL